MGEVDYLVVASEEAGGDAGIEPLADLLGVEVGGEEGVFADAGFEDFVEAGGVEFCGFVGEGVAGADVVYDEDGEVAEVGGEFGAWFVEFAEGYAPVPELAVDAVVSEVGAGVAG